MEPKDLGSYLFDVLNATNRTMAKAYSDPAFMSSSQLAELQAQERARIRSVRDRADRMLSDPSFVREFLADFADELAPALIVTMSPNSDPGAFRKAVQALALRIAEQQINGTSDDTEPGTNLPVFLRKQAD